MSALPIGTVTFLFTDIEGSTKLIQRLGDEARTVFSRHDAIMREAIEGAGGVVVRTEGDSFFAAFASGRAAVTAATNAQRGIGAASWPNAEQVRVRMGLHSGEGVLGGEDYLGLDVHRAARIAASAHGGQIVASQATRALADDVAGVTYLDFGEHRFKDLLQPERVFQVIADGLRVEFPPLNSLSAIPNNLPVELTSFVDRPEVASAGALLDRHRLLTLTGPGGMGKTRLAIQIAAERADLYEGVYFVALDSVTDPALVATAILSTAQLGDSSGDPAQRLAEYLANRSYLLVLDNFEQVLGAAPLVADLLRAAPGLHFVVTSRAALRIAGEQEFEVPPLATPNGKRDIETLRTIGSVALFVERAMAARPTFALDIANAGAIAEIAKRLDGLPLAIELAAARVKLLTPQTMLERLGSSIDLLASNRRDLPDRQRTLRGAISWSYDLLSPEEQRLIRFLSVFRGGATLNAVERVCNAAYQRSPDLLGLLETLIDHSLLRVDERAGEPRYGMLETIRAFAWEELKATDECEAVEVAHLDVFVDFATEESPLLTSAEQKSALVRFDAELSNLRAALSFATSTGRAEAAHRLASPMWRYWHMRGLVREGRARIDAALALDPGDPALRSATYDAAGGLAYWANDMAAAGHLYQRSLEEAEAAGEQRLIGFAHYNLTFPAMMEDPDNADTDTGRAHLDAAEAIFTATGDALGLASVMWGRTMVAIGLEDFSEVPALGMKAHDMFQRAGDPFMAAWSLHNAELGFIRQGQVTSAIPLADQALEGFVMTADVSGLTLTLGNLAYIAFTLGHDELGVRAWGAARAIASRSGINLVEAASGFLGLGVEEAVERLDLADFTAWEAAGKALDMDAAIALGREIIAVAREQAGDA